ncbi:MAG TPA: orotate phosphoribosyltransferase [Firmicutes bacterium]|nr:orotate phosphoribosyltransferase [Bacillota bacterium]
MTEPESTPENLAKLFYIYAYSRGKFVLSSGRVSSYYLNGKQVTLSARGLYTSARLLLERIAGQSPDAVGGLSFGAAPLAAAVSALSCCSQLQAPVSSFIVRKEPKQHGTRSRIEGPFYRGINTVIIDDVLTTGASVLSAAQAVEEAGGKVKKICVLVDRLEGGKENVEKQGYRLESIITRRDLERFDRLLRQKYPLFTTVLELQPVNWARLAEGCREVSGYHPRLGSTLKQEITRLKSELGPLSVLPPGLRSYLLRPVKIAEFSVDPESACDQACRSLSVDFTGGADS